MPGETRVVRGTQAERRGRTPVPLGAAPAGVLAYTAETGLANNTAVTLANSDDGVAGFAWTPITAGGGTVRYSTSSPLSGSLSIEYAAPVTADVARSDITGTFSNTNLVFDIAFRTPTYPSASTRILEVLGGGTSALRIEINTTGKILAYNSAASLIWTSTMSVPTATTGWRLGGRVVAATTTTGRLELTIYSPKDSTSAAESMTTITNGNFGTVAHDTLRIGKITSSPTWAAFYTDNWQLSTERTTLFGAPYAGIGPTPVPDPEPENPTFTLGTTEPVGSNTGAGVIRPYPTTVVNGDVTLTGTQSLVDTIVNGRVICNGDNLVENCVIRGSATAPTSQIQLVSCANATVRARISFCDICPQTPSAYWAGMGTRRYYAYRCKIWNCTDSFAAFTSAADGICNILIEGCYSPDMTRFAPDYANGNRAETHNDTIQLQGNKNDATDIILDGNSFIAVHSTTTGTLPVVHTQIAAVMITPNTQSTCAGTFRNNWFRGGIYTFNAGGATSGTVVVTGNRFQRPGSTTPNNTQALVLDSGLTRTVSGNTFIDNGAAVSVVNG